MLKETKNFTKYEYENIGSELLQQYICLVSCRLAINDIFWF